MDIVQAILLSIVEGISEFLPISSTGHLILASSILHVAQTDFAKSFEIIIQLGAILSVSLLYWRRIWRNKYLWKPLIIAFIPTGVLGLVFYKLIKTFLLGNDLVTVSALIIGGVILLFIDKLLDKKVVHKIEIKQLTWQKSVAIGLAQSVSMIPGVSRSAASIIGGMMVGLNREQAVEFSFMLAIPTMLAATGLDLVKSSTKFTGSEWLMLVIGLVGSFVSAMFVVRWFIKFIQKHNFQVFGIYRIIVGVLFWLLFLR